MCKILMDGKACAFICSSELTLDRLLTIARRLSKDDKFILLADCSELAIKRLAPAYLNAIVRMHDGMMRAGSIDLEMLLLISNTMRVSEAIAKSGAKGKDSFLAFATSYALFRRFVESSGLRVKKRIAIRLDPALSQEVAMTELLSEK